MLTLILPNLSLMTLLLILAWPVTLASPARMVMGIVANPPPNPRETVALAPPIPMGLVAHLHPLLRAPRARRVTVVLAPPEPMGPMAQTLIIRVIMGHA